MSVQFGKWNSDGQPIDPKYLARVKALIAPYGPDDEGTYAISNLSILNFSFHTTKESRRESQPHVTSSGAIFTWDGRLDNRTELIGQLGNPVTAHSTDLEIVSAAYECRREKSFAMLIGDWALSIWNPHTRSLVLAKDPIGARQLYYSIDSFQITWSTILDPLVLFAGRSFALCEEYIAGWFSTLPAAHLTPYVGIRSVPPSSSVLIQPGKHIVSKYWDFDPSKRIRYRSDGAYEEHFRSVFGEAVRRRLRSDSPILAELSGGMDSSSIVCMADALIAQGDAGTPRLDTISYYDDSEPNWNERPYFAKVEAKRGRTGIHIDVGKRQPFAFETDNDHFAATPSTGRDRRSEASRQFAACMTSQGYRVLLSGSGGDEVTGGVPTPVPELADLLARGHFRTLAHQLKVWALNKRKPWFHLFFSAATGFFPQALIRAPKHKRPAAWLNADFVKRNRAALHGYPRRLILIGPLPTFQENLSTLEVLRRQLASAALPSEPLYEIRYPYLDRGLLEFIYSIPREQLVRPGQRRSLMRRALTGIVPDDLLNRKRKAYVARGPIADISAHWTGYADLAQHMISDNLGIVETNAFVAGLQKARHGKEVPVVALMRTLSIEIWLKNLRNHRIPNGLPEAPLRNLSETSSSVARN